MLVRNQRTSKFQPIFRPEPYMVLENDLKAKRIVLESTVSQFLITLSTNILFTNMEYIKLLYFQSNNSILLLSSMQKTKKIKNV